MNRRFFLGSLLSLGAGVTTAHTAAPPSRTTAPPSRTIRFGVTAVFLYDRPRMLARWQSYLEGATGARVQFVRRGVYSPIIDGLRAGQIDFAWICGFPYVLHAREFRLIAVPAWRNAPLYQSYLIAGVGSKVTSLADLRGRTFAFSDPLSNSGYLYVRYLLAQQKERVDSSFGRSFFAHSHPNVVEAVADGLADGGAVDGMIVLSVLTACAPTTLKSVWKDDSYRQGHLKKVLIIGVDRNETVKKLLEDEFSVQLKQEVLRCFKVTVFFRKKKSLISGSLRQRSENYR